MSQPPTRLYCALTSGQNRFACPRASLGDKEEITVLIASDVL